MVVNEEEISGTALVLEADLSDIERPLQAILLS